MAYQMNDFSGVLFQNDRKNPQDPNDRSPHFRGRCIINGQEWSIASWWAYPQNGGAAYLSIKFEPPRQPQPQQGYAPSPYPPQPQGGYPAYQQGHSPSPYPPQPQYQIAPQPQYQQMPPQQSIPNTDDLPEGF